MNLNQSIIKSSKSPEQILQEATSLASLRVAEPSRPGWSYFTRGHALKTAAVVLKLYRSTSKQAIIDTNESVEQPSTIRARLTQGKAYITVNGAACLSPDHDDEAIDIVANNIQLLEISLRRNSILLRLRTAAPKDFIDAMRIVEEDAPPTVVESKTTFNEEAFRAELIDFVNRAEVDTQKEFIKLPRSAINYAKSVAAQDESLVVEQLGDSTIIMKLSPEAKAQLDAL